MHQNLIDSHPIPDSNPTHEQNPYLSSLYGLNEASIFSVLGNTLRPLAILGIRGILGVVDYTQTTIEFVREEVEDIVAEAQFERYKRQMDKEIEMDDSGKEKESE